MIKSTFQMVASGLAAAVLVPAAGAALAEVRLNYVIYTNSSTLTAVVTVDPGLLVTNKNLYLVSSSSGDAEVIPLSRSSDSDPYTTSSALSVRLDDGSVPVAPGDNVFVAGRNEVFFAFFVPVAFDGDTNKSKAYLDFGIMDNPGQSEPAAVVMPELAMTEDEKTIPPGGKRIATLAQQGGLAVQLPLDELILYPADGAELARFLAETQGEILMDDTLPAAPGQPAPVPRSYLIQVNKSGADVAHLAQMRSLFNEKETLLVSNPELLQLYALTLQLKMEGYHVGVNPRLQFMGAPATRDGIRAGMPTPGINAMSPDPSQATSIFADDLFGVRRAWAYLALWDKDTIEIPVAVLDMGFAPNWDFRGYNPSAPHLGLFQRNLEEGIESAVGPPTVGNSFFGPRSWHGNGVVTTLGGVLNNGWGSAGTGGQVVRPMLYKTGLRSYIFEMGRGMRLATDDGATIINISAGYPCRLVGSILVSGDICSVGGRAWFCGRITAALEAVTTAVCFIPYVGWLLCPVLEAGSVAGSALCFATVLAGDPRGPLREGVDYALDHGVSVVSIAGNKQNRMSIGILCDFVSCGEQDVSDWQIVPGVLDGVLCIGAADATPPYANNQYFGSRVDLWAPIGGVFWRPPTVDAVTGPEAQVDQGEFGGTSAAAPFVAGVIAMMQAVNPSLNPRTPGLTPAQRDAIPSRIGDILRDTASPAAALGGNSAEPNVARRRNLINACAAVRAAAQGVLPNMDARGYDSSLGFNEAAPNPNHDSPASALAVQTWLLEPTGVEFTETILSLPGSYWFQDEDWYAWQTNPNIPGIYSGGRVQIRQPLHSLSHPVFLNDEPGTLVQLWVAAGDTLVEELREYAIPPLLHATTFPIRVGSREGHDNPYKISFFPPRRTGDAPQPDPFDRSGTPFWPHSDNNSPQRAVPLGFTPPGLVVWREFPGDGLSTDGGVFLTVSNLNFHSGNDVDWFQIILPPGQAPTTCGACDPTLTIISGSGVATEVYGNDMSLIRRTSQSSVILSCRDYVGHLPLRFVLRPTRPGMVVNYDLMVIWSHPTEFTCAARTQMRDSIFWQFPFPYDPLTDPNPLGRPEDFTLDPAGRILDPQRYSFVWNKAETFNLLATVPPAESLKVQLLDANLQVLTEAATPDLSGGSPPLGGDASALILTAPNLLPGGYFLAVSHVRFGVPLGLYPSRAAMPDATLGFENFFVTGFIPGDFNRDGSFDQTDLSDLHDLLITQDPPTPEQLQAADANGDGKLDTTDQALLLDALTGQLDLYALWPVPIPRSTLSQHYDFVDTDGDGLPDWWELAHGLDPGNPADAKADADDDGSTNLEEYQAGTDPQSPQSVFQVRLQVGTRDALRLSFSALPGKSYTIEAADSLSPAIWHGLMDVPAQFYSRTAVLDLKPSAMGSGRFFRVVSPLQP